MSTDIQPVPHETALEKTAQKRLMDMLGSYKKSFQSVLPKHLNEERFVWLLVNNIRRTPALLGVSPQSFVNCVMLASNLGLEIRQNSAYLIPFGKECTLVIDYRGKMDLARRAGCGAIDVQLVREWDEFSYEFSLNGREFSHKPLLFTKAEDGRMVPITSEDRGEYVLGYGAAELPSGKEWQLAIMTLSEIEAIRKRARGGRGDLTLAQIRATDVSKVPYKDRTPWLTDYDQMACKTLVHRLCKGLPQTPEMILSDDVDNALDSGAKMPLAHSALLDIDPEWEQPMLPTGSVEEQQAVLERKLAESVAATSGRARRVTDNQVVSEVQAKTLTSLRAQAGMPQERFANILGEYGYTATQQVLGKDFDAIKARLKAFEEVEVNA